MQKLSEETVIDKREMRHGRVVSVEVCIGLPTYDPPTIHIIDSFNCECFDLEETRWLLAALKKAEEFVSKIPLVIDPDEEEELGEVVSVQTSHLFPIRFCAGYLMRERQEDAVN